MTATLIFLTAKQITNNKTYVNHYSFLLKTGKRGENAKNCNELKTIDAKVVSGKNRSFKTKHIGFCSFIWKIFLIIIETHLTISRL